MAATEDHYLPHEVWLFGPFDWKRYVPDVEADIRIAREAQPFRSTYAAEGLHDWLTYTWELLRRPASPAMGGYPVRVEASAAESITPPLAAKSGESITGFREFISPAGSATYKIEVPADGEYTLRASCAGTGSFNILIDESSTRTYTLSHSGVEKVHTLGAKLQLGQGIHTVRFFGSKPGAKLSWFELAPGK